MSCFCLHANLCWSTAPDVGESFEERKAKRFKTTALRALKLLLPYMQQRYIGEVFSADGSRAAAVPNRSSWSVVGWTVGPLAVQRHTEGPEHVAQQLLLDFPRGK